MLGLITKLLTPPAPRFDGVMGIYQYVDDACDAVKALRGAGFGKRMHVYSPVPYHDIEHAMEQGPSLVRWVTFTGGLLGCTGGFALAIYTVLSYPLVTGGKELISIPGFVVIGYESMILLAGLATLLGMLALARLPEVRPVAPYDPRFQEDRIGIWVPCGKDDRARVESMMKGHGAEEVHVHGA